MIHYILSYLIVDISCGLFALILLNHVGYDYGNTYSIRTFKLMLMFFIGYLVCDAVWVLSQFHYLPVILNRISVIGAMITICLFIYSCFIYGTIQMDLQYIGVFNFHFLTSFSYNVLFVFILTSVKTGWLFSFDEHGLVDFHYSFIIIFIVNCSYLLIISAKAAFRAYKAKNDDDRRTYLSLTSFMLIPVLSGYFYFKDQYLPIQPPIIICILTLIFTLRQDHRIYSDALTKLNNRRKLRKYCDERLEDAQYKPFYFCMIDINDFKSINDTYGHHIGDEALKILSLALSQLSRNKHCFVARWGGDEFAIIIDKQFFTSPQHICEEIQQTFYKENTNPVLKDLTISLGTYYVNNNQLTLAELYKSSDHNMYIQKRAYHNKK